VGGLQLEQIVERLARIIDARRGCLAFDRGAGRIERARVDSILRRDSRRDRLHALEAAPRVERLALRTGMQFCAASRTAARASHLFFDDGATLRTPDDLAEAGHVDIARTILRNAARTGGRTRLRRRTRRLRCRLPVAIVVVVAALAVFALAHLCDGKLPVDSSRRQSRIKLDVDVEPNSQ